MESLYAVLIQLFFLPRFSHPDIHYPFLSQVRCPAEDCRAEFLENGGHDKCRAHSFCSYLVNGVSVWHPDECGSCWELWQILHDPEVSCFPLPSLNY